MSYQHSHAASAAGPLCCTFKVLPLALQSWHGRRFLALFLGRKSHILPISFVLFLPLGLRHVCSTNLLKRSVLCFRLRFYYAKTKLCKCNTTGQLQLLRDCVDNSLNFNRNITISLQTRVFFLFKMLIFKFN